MTIKQTLLLALSMGTFWTHAQENLDFSKSRNSINPTVNKDSVHFTIRAPQAQSIKLQGNWMTGQGAVDMQKNAEGIWKYSIATPSPDLYSYHFIVDGVKTTDPNNVYNLRDVASVSSIFFVPGETADYYMVHDVPHGTVAKRWYPSKGLHMDRRITIYTPPGYESSKEKLPVLYLLHGVGGDEEAWSTSGHAPQILDNLIAAGQVKPMIVVMPNGHTNNSAAPGESSKGYYYPEMMTPDVFNGDMETYFPEIISFVEQNYRVRKDKNSRAIAGLSMGGFHSLYISANQANTFGYVGLFSPAIMPPKDAQVAVYQNLDEKLKTQKANGLKLYWVAIGKTDFLYKNVQDYRKKLEELQLPYEYKESEGGHTWSNWRQYLTEFTPLLFK